MFETHFTECKFVGSTFEKCSHDLMTVAGGNWSHVGLAGADLRKSTFHNTRLREADMSSARCDGTSLLDCDLSGALLTNVDFTDADLRGSDISALDPENARVRGAIITMEQAISIATALGLDVRAE